jgi:hypothetical protein
VDIHGIGDHIAGFVGVATARDSTRGNVRVLRANATGANIVVKVGGMELHALLDTGSDLNLMDQRLVDNPCIRNSIVQR